MLLNPNGSIKSDAHENGVWRIEPSGLVFVGRRDPQDGHRFKVVDADTLELVEPKRNPPTQMKRIGQTIAVNRCGKRCCSRTLWYWQRDEASKKKCQALVPLKQVDLTGVVSGGLANIQVTLCYTNVFKEPINDCKFDFPLTAKSMVTKLEGRIGARVVQCNLQDKQGGVVEKAFAAKNGVSVAIGNLLPGESATITLGFIEELSVDRGAWVFSIPSSFFPDYSKHTGGEGSRFPFKFAYEVKIREKGKIAYLSAPNGSSHNFNAQKTEVTVKGAAIERELKMFYRTNQMQMPRLMYEENPNFSGEVAVCVSFVFVLELVTHFEIVVKDEEPVA